MKYKYTKTMSEISGMGGGYEEACRKMVIAGLAYLDKRAEADPRFSTFKHIYGIVKAENKDAQELEDAMLKVVDDATGAMMQACVSHIMWIRKNGWKNYVKEMTDAK